MLTNTEKLVIAVIIICVFVVHNEGLLFSPLEP